MDVLNERADLASTLVLRDPGLRLTTGQCLADDLDERPITGQEHARRTTSASELRVVDRVQPRQGFPRPRNTRDETTDPLPFALRRLDRVDEAFCRPAQVLGVGM